MPWVMGRMQHRLGVGLDLAIFSQREISQQLCEMSGWTELRRGPGESEALQAALTGSLVSPGSARTPGHFYWVDFYWLQNLLAYGHKQHKTIINITHDTCLANRSIHNTFDQRIPLTDKKTGCFLSFLAANNTVVWPTA